MMMKLAFLPILSEIAEKNNRPPKFNAALIETIVEASSGFFVNNFVIISANREITKSPNNVLVRKIM